jgi:hypothetical protein
MARLIEEAEDGMDMNPSFLLKEETENSQICSFTEKEVEREETEESDEAAMAEKIAKAILAIYNQ